MTAYYRLECEEGYEGNAPFALAAAQNSKALAPHIAALLAQDTPPAFAAVCRDDMLRSLVKRQVAKWRALGFNHLVILGTGGASLGARALLDLPQSKAAKNGAMDVSILENADPHTAQTLLETLDPKTSAVLAISKSGKTVETLSYFYLMRKFYETALGKEALATHMLVLTNTLSESENPLYALAQSYNIPCWDHDGEVSGRYSVFTAVGLLPAAAAGLDIDALHRGAASVWEALNAPDNAVLRGTALHAAWAEQYPITVLMPYGNGFRDLGAWYRQLWAESLGKAGRGTTPICFQGAVDQHSQLQLYLEGPQDKCYSFVLGEPEGRGPALHAEQGYLQGKRIGDVLAAQQQSTLDVFRTHTLPARSFIYSAMDEATMGALMMHWMLETMLIANVWGIDPFDQPAVEEGKTLARRYLAGKTV